MDAYIITGSILNPIDIDRVEWLPDGIIVVSQHGNIEYIGARESLPGRYGNVQKTDLSDHIITPGFVDLHVHLPQYRCRGKFGASLLEWLEKFMYPEESTFIDEHVAQTTAQDFFSDMIRCGTTTAMVFSSSYARAAHIAFEEAERSQLRIIMGKTQMDRNVPAALLEETQSSLRETEELINCWHRKTDRLWYAVTPRFAAACSMQLMIECAALAGKHNTYIQTHINETQQEIEWVRSLFPHHTSYTHVYEDAGLLSSSTVLAHNLHPGDDEIDRCIRHRVGIAHCPDSNLFLGSGRFPLGRYEQTPLHIGLGSDVGAGTSLSMFRIMRSMAHAQMKSIHPFALLYYATLGGARALSLDHLIGSFSVGKSFDAIAVKWKSIMNHLSPLAASSVDAASALVYLAEASHIEKVFVQGSELLHNSV